MIHPARIVRAVLRTPWAILPEKLEEIVAFLDAYASGMRLTVGEVQARIGPPKPAEARVTGAVGVLPLHGAIFQRANLITDISGGVSAERFASALDGMLADEAVSAVMIDVDSPGGSVFGISELAGRVRAMRGRKPLVAVVDSLAASAAYWVATAADEVVITPGGLLGAVGVVALHTDRSGQQAHAGLTTTVITAGKHKGAESEYAPLSETARAQIQERVDYYYDLFVRDVAVSRGVSPSVVRDGYGEGRLVNAREAVTLGMADRIATADEVLERLLTRQPLSRSVANTRTARGAAADATAPTVAAGHSAAAAVRQYWRLIGPRDDAAISGR